jgi:hypothetical protein
MEMAKVSDWAATAQRGGMNMVDRMFILNSFYIG